MNRAESKYFNTALRMDEAMIALLEVKDLEYITVKEICEKAGVNRSTFYLHYETVADLVNEAIEVVNQRFLSYFTQNSGSVTGEIGRKDPEELILVTGNYLRPYLQFVKDHKNVYRAAFRNPGGMQADVRYRHLKKNIFEPILKRFGIPEPLHKYYIAYYIEGIMAVIKEWLNNDCQEPVEAVSDMLENCVRHCQGK